MCKCNIILSSVDSICPQYLPFESREQAQAVANWLMKNTELYSIAIYPAFSPKADRWVNKSTGWVKTESA
jgi:hypothetical protein